MRVSFSEIAEVVALQNSLDPRDCVPWLLLPKGDGWSEICDVTNGVVISAPSVAMARRIAAAHSGDEGPQVWMDSKFSSCVEVGPGMKPGLILRDFFNG